MKRAEPSMLTKVQRDWVLERDSHSCQNFLFRNGKWVRCGRSVRLEVHHILPRRWMDRFLPTRLKHTPSNLITLCHDCHCGIDGVHPDMSIASRNYSINRQSFQETFENRNKLLNQGKTYWNTDRDWMFLRRVKVLNGQFKKKFPR